MKLNQKIIQNCKSEELRKSLFRLSELNDYYSLLEGGVISYTKVFETVGKMPTQLKEWLKIFDGGFLFSVSMFSMRKHVEGEGHYLTFAEINSEEFRKEHGIPSSVVCFAMTNYGNYYCYDFDDNSEAIYEWETDEQVANREWASFSDWLNEQIEDANADIKDGFLSPMED